MSCHHDHQHAPPPIPTNPSHNLYHRIDTTQLTALNLANPKDELAQLFRAPDDKYKLKPVIKSDADAQLIINIPFTNSLVKLYLLIVRSNGQDHCPRHIKLYKNDKLIDFDSSKKPEYVVEQPRLGVMYDDEDDMPASDNLDTFVEHFLPRHKFTGLQQLTLYIEDLWDEDTDESWLHYIELRGEATDLTADPVITIYEAAANPADHKKVELEVNNVMGV